MDRPMWNSLAAKWTVAVIAVLVLAIVAGRVLLHGERFALKPATGSARAMAEASDRPLAEQTPRR